MYRRPESMAEVTHTEIGVDDTLDYGRLLEPATEIYVKRVASQRRFGDGCTLWAEGTIAA